VIRHPETEAQDLLLQSLSLRSDSSGHARNQKKREFGGSGGSKGKKWRGEKETIFSQRYASRMGQKLY